jgi:3-isopropylmalate/(R)-2-methylmalate dehydratase small subunit
MIVQGYVLRIEQSLEPAQIIAPAYAEIGDPAELAAHCLEHVDPDLAANAREGDLLVVAGNVRDGVGAEAAIYALQALGLAAWICTDADPALVVRSTRAGLPMIRLGNTSLPSSGALLRIDLARGVAEDQSLCWTFDPLTSPELEAARRTQLLSRMRRIVEDEGLAE